MKEEFYLCYVEDGKCWFTNNWEEQWGDDWNDAPYEHNAGVPYTEYSILVEDNEEWQKRVYEHYPIGHIVCYVEFPYNWVYEPKDRTECKKNECNSKYSVQDINNSIKTNNPIPWLKCNEFSIYPKTTFEEFVKIVKEQDAKIYTLMEEFKDE